MTDALKKVQAGQNLRIPAAAYNAFVDAAADLKRRETNIGARTSSPPEQNGIVLMKNMSGEHRARFEVLGINGPVHTPADNEAAFLDKPALIGVAPTRPGGFAILLEPIHSEAMGLAMVSGLTVARIMVLDTRHAFAGADPVWPMLTSDPLGSARVLWKEDGISLDETDLKWAVVMLGQDPEPCVGVTREGEPSNSGFASVLVFSDPVVFTQIAPGIVRVEMYA